MIKLRPSSLIWGVGIMAGIILTDQSEGKI